MISLPSTNPRAEKKTSAHGSSGRRIHQYTSTSLSCAEPHPSTSHPPASFPKHTMPKYSPPYKKYYPPSLHSTPPHHTVGLHAQRTLTTTTTRKYLPPAYPVRHTYSPLPHKP
ncbi:hypothetical protein M758_10G012000 [Ceratodon purpureus]|nr:hypothetical protein M758_10G012000 [Ceratodon purpureus]